MPTFTDIRDAIAALALVAFVACVCINFGA
jgi:hypothetical protein